MHRPPSRPPSPATRPPSSAPLATAARLRAFTLVELLTVIAIVAVLAALLLPAVSAARVHSRKTTELSAARQLLVAYHAYAHENRGVLLAAAPAGRAATTEGGTTLSGVPASRWPHHLRPYLGDRFRAVLYVNEQAAYYDRHQAADYSLSLAPSFGMNGAFVGGGVGGRLLDPPLTRLERAAQPSALIAFAAARHRALSPDAGFFYVNAPSSWSGPDQPRTDTAPGLDALYGYLAPRWSDRAVVAHLDGSVALLPAATLRDMRLWSDAARRADSPAYRPAPAP